MAIGLGDIFSIGSSLLSGGSSSSTTSYAPQAPDVSFTRYMRKYQEPETAGKVGGIGKTSADYTQFLQAWDNYLNNDYLEMSKRMGL